MDYVTVYAIDTSTLWTVYGHLTEPQAQPLFDRAKTDQSNHVLMAGATVAVAAELKATAADPAGQNALAACTTYLAQTETYRQVMAKHESAIGHWLVVLYQFASGEATVRPMYLGTNNGKAGRIEPPQLLYSLLEVIRRDLRPDGGMLVSRIQAQGDVKLAPALAQRLRPH